MRKLIYILTITLVALSACHEQKTGNATKCGADIPAEFFNKSIAFGDNAEQVVKGMMSQGFQDAAGQPIMNFDSVPDNMGNYVAMKAFVPIDSTGFEFQGVKWDKVQVQLDQKGLFSVIFFSKPITNAQIDRYDSALLHAFQSQGYLLRPTKIGRSMLNGYATDIMGFRYEQGGRLVQLHSNQVDERTSIIVLIFNQLQ